MCKWMSEQNVWKNINDNKKGLHRNRRCGEQ